MRHTIPLLAMGGFCLAALPIRAQFYAPETRYHDPVQRVFPVEAARVLAWIANQGSNRIAEISYRVNVSSNGVTSWDLLSADATGRTVRTGKVEYAETLLKRGPDYYREVMRQLISSDPVQPGGFTSAQARDAFWEGAALAGRSREESLTAALRLSLSRAAVTNGLWAPKLSGLLAHAALPSLGARVSLDDQLLARSAALLAFTERARADELPQLWTPVLFLAGRERAAGETWRTNRGALAPIAPGGVAAAWDFWLKQPSTEAAYLFALDTTNKAIAMAMLAYDVDINRSGDILAEVVEPFAGSERDLTRLHNYATLFAIECGVSGGHIMDGWAAAQRFAWLQLLDDYCRSVKEKPAFVPMLQQATNALSRVEANPDLDSCLIGFKETVPLLRAGYQASSGKFAPTAIVAADDLLSYGWEMSGLQMGSRYFFVDHRWGVHEQARPIVDTALREVESLYPFFKPPIQANGVREYINYMFRAQHVSRLYNLIGQSPNSPPTIYPGFLIGGQQAPLKFSRECWLRPDLFAWQMHALWMLPDPDGMPELLAAVEQEEGQRGAAEALRYISQFNTNNYPRIKNVVDWMSRFAAHLPQPSSLTIRTLLKTRLAGKPELEQAKALEQLYWSNPDVEVQSLIFNLYVKAGAFDAARRFYNRARDYFIDSVKVSNGIGTSAFVLGYLKNDPLLRLAAMKDSESASAADMILSIWDAAIRDRRDEISFRANEMIERYESDGAEGVGGKIKGFVPLLPALADAQHPQHQQALRYFGDFKGAVILRWIWVEQFKLSKEDAIALFGGISVSDPVRQVMFSYLNHDVEGARRHYQVALQTRDVQDEQLLLARFLLLRLTNEKEPDVPDVKPANVSSARAAILARIAKRQ